MLAITIRHYASAMQCVNQSVILFCLHGVHPRRFCLPKQVSHLHFVINGIRSICCNWSKFRGITALSLPQTAIIIYPFVPTCPVNLTLGATAVHMLIKATGSCFKISVFTCIGCCDLLVQDSKKIQYVFM